VVVVRDNIKVNPEKEREHDPTMAVSIRFRVCCKESWCFGIIFVNITRAYTRKICSN
jgi:hypothetical protein